MPTHLKDCVNVGSRFFTVFGLISNNACRDFTLKISALSRASCFQSTIVSSSSLEAIRYRFCGGSRLDIRVSSELCFLLLRVES